MEPIPELRPYQREAIDKAVARRKMLLALVQGAGKTRVAIETIEELRDDPEWGGAPIFGCVFCPATLKFQWANSEIPKWAPNATVRVIQGTKEQRTAQYMADPPADYTILNYECLIHDWDLIKEFLPIDFVIADEVTAIKGMRAKRTKRLKVIGRHAPIKLGLSGQPIENRPEELYSIMQFIDPDVLGTFDKFDRTFIRRDHWGKPVKFVNLPTLKTTMEPAMFRRSRADIAEFLPERVETEIPIPLDETSQKVYDWVAEDLLATIAEAVGAGHGKFDLFAHYGFGGDEESNRLRGQVMSRITALRLLCAHPQLLEISADNFDDPDTDTGSEYASFLRQEGVTSPLQGQLSCSKQEALLAQIEEILSEDDLNKVVVFCTFKPMLRLLGASLRQKKIGYTTISGDTPVPERERRRDRFNSDPAVQVFLSSDAGAYGVNLDKGSHLFSYDLPWSAGVLGQRVARIDRTSSLHRTINIGYLYSASTIEEHQMRLLTQKMRIGEAFIDGKHQDQRGHMKLTLDTLSAFLRT